MLGRDLINYIYANNLQDTKVFEGGKLIGFLSDEEAAEKFDVGVSTILVWINQGKLDGIRVNDRIFIPFNSKDPRTNDESVPAIE